MTLITYQEVEQQAHCCSLWSLWHRSLEAGLKIYKLNKTLIVYGKTTFCHRNKKVIIEPFLYFSYKSRGAIFLRWSRTIVIRLELNWLCRQREGSVHPERLHSWEIIFKSSPWNIFKFQCGKAKSWAPTWGHRAGLVSLHKVVVVCDGVTVFKHISNILVTLKEQ